MNIFSDASLNLIDHEDASFNVIDHEDASFNVIDHEDASFNVIDELQQDNQFNIYNTEEILEFLKNNIEIKNNISNTNDAETEIQNISKIEVNNILNEANVTNISLFQENVDCSLPLSQIGKPKTLGLLINKYNRKEDKDNRKEDKDKASDIEFPEFEKGVPKCSGSSYFNATISGSTPTLTLIFETKYKLIRETNTTMRTSLMARALYKITGSTDYIDDEGEHVFTDTTTTFSNIGVGFSLNVPGYDINIPSFTIPLPMIDRGCDDLSRICIPNCKWEHPCYRSCGPRIFGRRICVKICSPIPIPMKSDIHIKFNGYQIPSKKLFSIEETIIGLDFNVIPEFETDMQINYKLKAGSVSVKFDGELKTAMKSLTDVERSIQFEITKLVLGFTFRINKITMLVGGKGINWTNIDIPIISKFDICGDGRKIVSYVDSKNKLSLWYLLGTENLKLYDIIKELIIPGTPEIVINFCKQTKLVIKYGFLICPDSAIVLSFVVKSNCQLYPFRDLNKFDIPDINLNIPSIPRIPGLPIPQDWMNSANYGINQAGKGTAEAINTAQKIVKDYLENIVVSVDKESRVPIIYY
jgi:hypothetical protein